jgi:hypothetical protein
MKTKAGFWVKHGRQGSTSGFPGSFGGYVYERAAPSAYPKTAQQSKIGKCARDNVKKGMSGQAIHEAVRHCFGK